MRYLTLVAIFAAVILAPSVSRADGPPGSYRATCRHIHAWGDNLSAQCQDADGHWMNARLDHFRACQSEITNLNGTLTCEREHNRWGQGPQGSYSQTCREIHTDGNTLFAKCLSSNGDYLPARLDRVDACNDDITNVEGQLQCNKGEGNRGRYPSGSYTQTCREIHMEGDRIVARCQTADGGWHNTALEDFDRCRGDISNENGNLRCYRRGDRDRDGDDY